MLYVVDKSDMPLKLFLLLQRRYSPGWASASFKSFLHPSRFRATTFQFLHPSLATSSSTPSSQRSLGLPLGRFPPGSLKRTLIFLYLTVNFKFLNFTFQIFLLFVPEMSTSFISYTVQIIYIALVWILYPLHFNLLPLI